MTFRLVQIDDALRSEHFYLAPGDECYCLGEYYAGAGFGAGQVNDMLSNFKKPVSRRGLAEYRYKEAAILRAGNLVRSAVSRDAWRLCTFVPIPPSKARDDPLYDDRLTQVLSVGEPRFDVRELIVARASMRAHHDYAQGERRPDPDELYARLMVDRDQLREPIKQTVVIFDDLLTTGAHFVACKRHVLELVPGARVFGLFIGRRALGRDELH